MRSLTTQMMIMTVLLGIGQIPVVEMNHDLINLEDLFTLQECENHQLKSHHEVSVSESSKREVSDRAAETKCLKDTKHFKFTKSDCQDILKAKQLLFSTTGKSTAAIKSITKKKILPLLHKLKLSLISRNACEHEAKKLLLEEINAINHERLKKKYSQFVEIP